MADNFYINAVRIGNDICLREVRDGIQNKRKVRYEPTLFISSNGQQTEWRSLYGDSVKAVRFDSMSDAREFVQKYEGVDGVKLFGQTDYEMAFLNEYYPGVLEFDLNKISAWSIDIETRLPTDKFGKITGFPDIKTANSEINLITMEELSTGNCYSFGCKPYDGKDTLFTQCRDEADLLKQFIQFWNLKQVAVVTGWNIDFFDIPFIVNRINRILGEGSANKLSPWNRTTVDVKQFQGKEEISVKILGVSCIDYLALYKKFTYVKLESYSLAFVTQEELGETKLDHSEYENFNVFAEKGWNKFVQYNVRDARLVSKLERKLKLIELALTIAYRAKVNYSVVFGPVKTWDGIIHNALYSKKICVPFKEAVHDSDGIEGAYVKDPIPGWKYYTATLDATSLYPSIMMTLNMSPETFLGNEPGVTVDYLLEGNTINIPGDECWSPIGARFSKQKRGIVPELIEQYMAVRKTAKKQMLSIEQELEDIKQEINKRGLKID